MKILFIQSDVLLIFINVACGDIYVWDFRTRRCVNKIVNHSLYDANILSASTDGFIATGSNSGLVSLFDFTQSLNRTSDSHKVIKEFGNLSCSTSSVKFNTKLYLLLSLNTSNLMCFASNSLKKGIRMVDLTN
ncbi:hypothetical protein MXB_2332, partial [Myxobolus squamalis]